MNQPQALTLQVSNEFSQLVKMLGEQQTTVLMATHDLYRAKDIAIMRQGQLIDLSNNRGRSGRQSALFTC